MSTVWQQQLLLTIIINVTRVLLFCDLNTPPALVRTIPLHQCMWRSHFARLPLPLSCADVFYMRGPGDSPFSRHAEVLTIDLASHSRSAILSLILSLIPQDSVSKIFSLNISTSAVIDIWATLSCCHFECDLFKVQK